MSNPALEESGDRACASRLALDWIPALAGMTGYYVGFYLSLDRSKATFTTLPLSRSTI